LVRLPETAFRADTDTRRVRLVFLSQTVRAHSVALKAQFPKGSFDCNNRGTEFLQGPFRAPRARSFSPSALSPFAAVLAIQPPYERPGSTNQFARAGSARKRRERHARCRTFQQALHSVRRADHRLAHTTQRSAGGCSFGRLTVTVLVVRVFALPSAKSDAVGIRSAADCRRPRFALAPGTKRPVTPRDKESLPRRRPWPRVLSAPCRWGSSGREGTTTSRFRWRTRWLRHARPPGK
jgi:hypothetical protein